MKIKFNKYERVAGLFVITAILGGIVSMAGVAIKRGWFETKVVLETTLESADGIRIGTQVQMAGLRAGAVTHVELRSDKKIRVVFAISEKFHNRVREDSVVHAIRPFLIGEKVLDVTVGSESLPVVAQHAVLNSHPSTDLMDLISGRTLAPYLDTMVEMVENLRFIAEAILDPERSKAIVKIFDDLTPLVNNMNNMSSEVTGLIRQVNHKKKLSQVVDNLALLTEEMTKVLPVVSKDAPQLAQDLAKIAKNMAILTDEMQKTLPALQQIGPELPRASRRAIEALDETVVTLKALQRSFILSGKVEDVREEEAKERANKVKQNENGIRLPAEESPAEKAKDE